MSMFIFAHGGSEHITQTETISHNTPAIAGITVVALIILVVAARFLSRPDVKKDEK